MDNDSDSDKSYDKVSWDEFYISVTESDADGSAKSENIVSSDSVDSDSDKSSDEQGSFGYIDPEEVEQFAEFVFSETKVVGPSYKKRRSLAVPGDFPYPAFIIRREDMMIKDIIKENALPFLPAKSLARFKAVSRGWNQWITSPFLAHKQTYLFKGLSGFFCQDADDSRPTYIAIDEFSSGIRNPSLSFLPVDVAIRSSCYGLLLCQGILNDTDYYVCNPLNSEYLKIPQPNFYHGQDPAIVLAFEPSELNIAAHFEIICAVPVMDNPIVYFEIYSSDTRSWRLSVSESIEVGNSKMLGGGFYVNKIAYFMTDSGDVLGFDVSSEVCGVLSLPSDCDLNGVFTKMDGELSYVNACYSDENEYDLKVYGGMDMGLKRNWTISLDDDVRVGPHPKCQILPFVTNTFGDDFAFLAGKGVWSYHQSVHRVKFIGYSGNFMAKYFPFVSSLVHLPHE